jgi:hypothetical protein
MFDVTVTVGRDYELLPEDKWIPARLMSRGVQRFDGTTYSPSTDDVVRQAETNLKKAQALGDAVQLHLAWNNIKQYVFQFTFKPLLDKKFSGYTVRGNTGLNIQFENSTGDYEPNKLAELYLGLGGSRAGKDGKLDIDSVIGGYAAIKLVNKPGKKTTGKRRVYQNVVAVRALTDDELAQAKILEIELKHIEDAITAAEAKAEAEAADIEEGGVREVTQTPVLEKTEGTGPAPF